MTPPKSEITISNVMERHLQTVIQIIIVALIMWAGNAVIEARDATTRLLEQVAQVQVQVTEMNARFDRYLLRTEADARFNAEESKHQDMNRRLGELEQRRRN